MRETRERGTIFLPQFSSKRKRNTTDLPACLPARLPACLPARLPAGPRSLFVHTAQINRVLSKRVHKHTEKKSDDLALMLRHYYNNYYYFPLQLHLIWEA